VCSNTNPFHQGVAKAGEGGCESAGGARQGQTGSRGQRREIEAERAAPEKRAQDEQGRWQLEKEKPETALRQARER